MTRLPLVVIGTSAGGVAALKHLVSQLPPDFPAALGIVLHISADAPSLLPEILSRCGPLPAQQPQGRERLQAGRIYLAPPDHHLHVDGDHVEATKGPTENRHRPAVDVLFRSAAYTRGSDVIGVILTGLLSDGTSGFWAIRQRGGITVVQDPQDAEYDSMPRSALSHVDVQHVVPLQELAALLVSLVTQDRREEEVQAMDEQELRRLQVETKVARDERAYQRGVLDLGQASFISCPECHGTMVELREGSIIRFRCHTGHAFNSDSLLSALSKNSETQAYQLLRSLEETEVLLRRLARHSQELGDERRAQVLLGPIDELEAWGQGARDLALSNRRLSETGLLQGENDATVTKNGD